MANKAASQDENNPNAGDGAGDAFADYGKSYGADISVDGVGDVWNQPIQGNFNQLKKLKAKQPNLKILISIGGWTYSKYFSDAASTDAKRKTFVSSCVNMFIKGDLPVIDGFGGPGQRGRHLRRHRHRLGVPRLAERSRRQPLQPGGQAELHPAAGRVPSPARRLRRQCNGKKLLPDRRHAGRPGQDRHDRDRQDRRSTSTTTT